MGKNILLIINKFIENLAYLQNEVVLGVLWKFCKL